MASTTLMYDAVTPSRIPYPKLVKAVLVYIDGRYKWTDEDLALFPNAAKKRIATSASTDDGSVLDVERFDATPQQAVDWVVERRKCPENPLRSPATVYCSSSSWPLVRHLFDAADVPEPEYLIAEWDGVAAVPAGAVGKQYLPTPGYDVSVVESWWLG